ncbi:hypothetical protein FGIG_10031 [Fasciola gigantica]|uniref:Uncharacterized protein n=1 Tax=Fasciola gigantica TaxID=46835 RepID=A0A504YFD1_FASGI|nr:hypothetical protein FGIG_10031 [Fasciola gigantica]
MEAKPDQFIECFIAEQNLVGIGIGFFLCQYVNAQSRSLVLLRPF